MDTPIEAEVQAKKKKRQILVIVLVFVVFAAAILLFRSSLSTSIKRSAVTTAVVEMGTVDNTLTASGEVLPEFEQVITSPIQASVQQVMLDAGSSINAGQSILTLDKSSSETEYEKLKFQLASKRNSIKKLKLELDKSFFDIKSSNNVKQLRIDHLEAEVENAKRLFKAGGGTREDIEQAELDLKVARLEKLQLENEIRNKQQTMQVEMKEAEIAASIQQNELQELHRKLQLANISATRSGVVTWVNKNIGASIQEGDALARIADLSSFKVQGTITDEYLDQLHNGMPARIRINEQLLTGAIVNIQPSVQNGIVHFDIRLDSAGSKLLRPNQKVEVFLITASKSNTMRVMNGPAFRGPSIQEIFVVKGDQAERRKVTIGLSNFDYVEIVDNVRPGEAVITSDLNAYKNTRQITLKP